MGAIKNLLKSDSKFNYFKFLIQRSVKKNSTRLKIAKCLGNFSPEINFNQDNSQYDDLKGDSPFIIAEKLKSEGIEIIPQAFLSEEEIASIQSKIADEELHDPYSENKGFKRDSIPVDVHCSHYKRESLAKVSEILNLANDPGVLSVAKAYLGVTPTISNINLWWGTYGGGEPRDNELFHRDKDDYDFIKFFVYLTDTDENDYNIVYVKNSLNSSKAHDKLRYTLDEIREMFGSDNIIHATGPKGTGFFAANYGVHNGTLPKMPERKTLLLQIQYSIGPIPIENYSPINKDEIVGEVNNKLDPWVNRLILKGLNEC